MRERERTPRYASLRHAARLDYVDFLKSRATERSLVFQEVANGKFEILRDRDTKIRRTKRSSSAQKLFFMHVSADWEKNVFNPAALARRGSILTRLAAWEKQCFNLPGWEKENFILPHWGRTVDFGQPDLEKFKT